MVGYELGSWVGLAVAVAGVEPLVETALLEAYRELGVVQQVGINAALTIAVGFVVVGLLPGYSRRVVERARGSPIISIAVGVPSVAVLVTLVALGQLISTTEVGVFFAIPFVSVGVTFLPPGATLGFVTMGAMVASRIGTDNLGAWVVVGGTVAGVAAITPAITLALATAAAVVGTGAGIRVAMDTGLTNEPNERPVPPANQV